MGQWFNGLRDTFSNISELFHSGAGKGFQLRTLPTNLRQRGSQKVPRRHEGSIFSSSRQTTLMMLTMSLSSSEIELNKWSSVVEAICYRFGQRASSYERRGGVPPLSCVKIAAEKDLTKSEPK